MLNTKSSISCHQLSSVSPPSTTCLLKATDDHRASNMARGMPVRKPKAGASMYLLRAAAAHRSARAPNSYRVANTVTPMSFSNSPAVVGRMPRASSLSEVRRTINASCVIGNIAMK